MSSYVVNKATIDALVSYALKREIYRYFDRFLDIPQPQDPSKTGYANAMGQVLWKENVRGCMCQYPNEDYRGEQEESENYQFDDQRAPELLPVEIIKTGQCLAYNSCDTKDWLTTPAQLLLRQIIDAAINELPGYDEAQWNRREY